MMIVKLIFVSLITFISHSQFKGNYMTTFLSLIGGVKGIIISVIIALALGYIALQRHELSSANQARDTAIAQKIEIQGQLDKAIDVAKANQTTIDRLNSEKQSIQEALNKKDLDVANNQKTVNKTNVAIDKQANEPVNRVELSPVLKTTLEALQEERERRRAPPAPQAPKAKK